MGREIGTRALSRRREARAADEANRAGERASHEVSCMSGHRALLCDTANHTNIGAKSRARRDTPIAANPLQKSALSAVGTNASFFPAKKSNGFSAQTFSSHAIPGRS